MQSQILDNTSILRSPVTALQQNSTCLHVILECQGSPSCAQVDTGHIQHMLVLKSSGCLKESLKICQCIIVLLLPVVKHPQIAAGKRLALQTENPFEKSYVEGPSANLYQYEPERQNWLTVLPVQD